MRIWIVAAALVLGAFSYQQLKHQREMQLQQLRYQGAYEALQEELNRTRGNVLLAAKNASESRLELHRALQEEEEWSATEIPAGVAARLNSRVQ